MDAQCLSWEGVWEEEQFGLSEFQQRSVALKQLLLDGKAPL